MTTKVLIVDDHKLFRNGMRLLIETLPGYEVSGEAQHGLEFLEMTVIQLPDLVLLDIAMPVMNGIDAAREALNRYPDLKIIALSMFGDQDYYFAMVDAGVKGFLLKDSDIHEVKIAMDTVMDGGNYFSHEMLVKLVRSLKNSSRETSNTQILSTREVEVMLLICKGLSTQDVADVLFISKRTVDTHRANILAKTGCRNTAAMVVYAIRNHIMEL